MKALLLLLAGCPALSDADLQRRIDADADGSVSVSFGGPDCDDADPAVHPGAVEVCDGVDNDCDGQINAADPDMPDAVVGWWLDADRDGVGRDDEAVRSCATLPGYVHVGGDCDDTDPDQRPDQTWFLDGDGDGFGLEDRTRVQCERPSAYALTPGDCDDANGLVHPGAIEVCNLVDDDCNGPADEADPGVQGVQVWYPDADGDTYGDDAGGGPLCFPAETDVLVGGDCDDTRPAVHPSAPDAWYDGVDADCSGTSDYDQDGDGVDAPAGGGDDCDDLRAWIHPLAAEVCDGAPNACDDATWVPAAEDGLAHFVPVSGLPPVDHGVALTTGGAVTLVEDGTLFLCAGAWSGQVIVTGGTVSIAGPGGPGAASLDAGGVGATVDATGATTALTVDAVDLRGGTGHPTAVASLGGCLFADGVASVTVRDATLAGCSADLGGGALLRASGPVIAERLEIVGATATGSGGCLHLAGGPDSRVVDSRLEACTAADGGGLHASAPPSPGLALIGTAIAGNTATTGGGIFLASGTLVATGGAWTDNTADTGGGIYALGSARCDGTAVLRNASDGVYLDAFGLFEADLCDLGFGATDNTVDVANPAGSFVYDGVASFQCDRTTCTP